MHDTDWPNGLQAPQQSAVLGTARGAERRAGHLQPDPQPWSSSHEQNQHPDHRHQLPHPQDYSAYELEVPLAPLARRPPPHLDAGGGGSYSSSSSGHGAPYTAPPVPFNYTRDTQLPVLRHARYLPPPPPPPVASSSSAYVRPARSSTLTAPLQPLAYRDYLPVESASYLSSPLGDYPRSRAAASQGHPPSRQHEVAGIGQLRPASDNFEQPLQHAAQVHEVGGAGQWHPSAPPPLPLVPFGVPKPWVQQAQASIHSPYQACEPLQLDLQPPRCAALPHMTSSSLFPPQWQPSLFDTSSVSPAFETSTTSQGLRTQALEPTSRSGRAFASIDQPHPSRFSAYPPSTHAASASHPHSYTSYPPLALLHQPFDGSTDALAGLSAPTERSRPMLGSALAAAAWPPAPRRSYKVSQNPDKKLTVDLHTTCTVCAEPLAKLILRGKRAELDFPHAAVLTCLACSSIGTPLSKESKDGKLEKATFRKRNKRLNDASATITCDVCLRDIAIGGVLPLPLDTPDPTTRIDFLIEIVCAPCDVKYKRCSDCGGGGGSRVGTGKWRCAELFPPYRKTCSLKHQRLGAFPAMEYSVYRNTDIPCDEIDELSDSLRSMYVNSVLGGLCIPEVLEQDGAIYSTYEQCHERATQGWYGFDSLIRYNVEAQTGIRRYLALRTCTPNLRKPSRQTPGDSPAGSPEPGAGPDEPRLRHKHSGVVLKEGKEIAGFIIAEQELFVGNLFFCIVLPWDPTGEMFEATSVLISALIRHIDADVKQTSAERVQQGLPPLPDIAKVWTMLFFKRESRVLTSLVKKRGFAYLEDYLAEHPEVPAEEFPPYRKCYLPVEQQQEGWEVLVRHQSVTTDGAVDDWGARRATDEERSKRKEVRARAATVEGSR